jgi:hypothetical protein
VKLVIIMVIICSIVMLLLFISSISIEMMTLILIVRILLLRHRRVWLSGISLSIQIITNLVIVVITLWNVVISYLNDILDWINDYLLCSFIVIYDVFNFVWCCCSCLIAYLIVMSIGKLSLSKFNLANINIDIVLVTIVNIRSLRPKGLIIYDNSWALSFKSLFIWGLIRRKTCSCLLLRCFRCLKFLIWII